MGFRHIKIPCIHQGNAKSCEPKTQKKSDFSQFQRRVWGLTRDFSESPRSRIANRLDGGLLLIPVIREYDFLGIGLIQQPPYWERIL